MAGQHDDPEVPRVRVGAQSPGRLVAVHAGQGQVDDDHIGLHAAYGLERLAGAAHAADAVAEVRQIFGVDVTRLAGIVDDQDAGTWRRRHRGTYGFLRIPLGGTRTVLSVRDGRDACNSEPGSVAATE